MQFLRSAFFGRKIPSLLCGVLCAMAWLPLVAGESREALTARWAGQILRGLDAHPRLTASKALENEALANVDAASQPIYEPYLGMEWKSRGSQSLGSNFEFFIAQQVDLAGKSAARSKSLESGSRAVRADRHRIRQDLLQEILNGASDYWAATRVLKISTMRARRIERFVRILEKNQKAGQASQFEVDSGYLRWAEAIGQLAEAEQLNLQNSFRLRELIGDSRILAHLPSEFLEPLTPITNLAQKVNILPSVAAARWRFEVKRAEQDAVRAERTLDPTIGVIAGKDESDNFVGLNVVVPLALRSSSKAFHEASLQSALAEEQRYLESFRHAKVRLENAQAVYRKLFERWRQWDSLASSRLQTREDLLHRLWNAGQISTLDYLAGHEERENARMNAIQLTARVWAAWIEWLAATGELESWMQDLAGTKRQWKS